MSQTNSAVPNGVQAPAPSGRVVAAASYRVEVGLKTDAFDSDGARAMSLLASAGLSSLKSVRSAKIYLIRGPLTLSHVHQAAKELLCDAVTEEYRVLSPQPPMTGAGRWRAEIWLKPEVSDPVEDSIVAAFECAGIPKPVSARQGVVYYIESRAAQVALEKAAWRWLANPLIQRFSLAQSA